MNNRSARSIGRPRSSTIVWQWMIRVAMVASLALTLPLPALSAQKPNIIVILVDDLGFSDIGCYGSEIPTPNLDQLAHDGVQFTQFYNTPRCSPTRAAVMTGLYSHQAGMGWLDNKVEPKSQGFHGRLLPRCVTIAEVLREAGYFTAMTGKWHLGQQNGTPPWESRPEDRKKRFDEIMSVYAAMVDRIDRSVGRLVAGLKDREALDNTLIVFLSDNGGNAEGGPPGVTGGTGAVGGPQSYVLLGTRREQGRAPRQVETRPEVARPLGTL